MDCGKTGQGVHRPPRQGIPFVQLPALHAPPPGLAPSVCLVHHPHAPPPLYPQECNKCISWHPPRVPTESIRSSRALRAASLMPSRGRGPWRPGNCFSWPFARAIFCLLHWSQVVRHS